MARTGITAEQVAQAADALLAAGRVGPDGTPTIAAVREHLGGTGSPNTIHAHLSVWKARRPAALPASNELPIGLIRAIRDEMERVAAEARAQIEGKLVSSEAAVTELARAGEALESELATERERGSELTTERDRLAGALEAAQQQLTQLQTALEAERNGAEYLRVDLAKERLKAESQNELVTALRDETSALRADLAKERSERVAAERELAAAESARDELRRSVSQLEQQRDALAQDRDAARGLLEQERKTSSEVGRQLSAEVEKAKAAEARAADLQAREHALRDELAQLRVNPAAAPSQAAPKAKPSK